MLNKDTTPTCSLQWALCISSVVTETGFAGASVVVAALGSCCAEGSLADILHYIVEQVFLGTLLKVKIAYTPVYAICLGAFSHLPILYKGYSLLYCGCML